MRTSRISRDTAHIVDALAARPRRAAAQQALRTISPALPPADTDDSELSAPPDSPDAAAEDDTRRKRKRGAQTRGKQKVKKEKATAESGRGVAPFNWQQMYECAALMRKKVIAPVDTMGCESLAEAHCSPVDRRLQTLVALMLSSQTKDTVTAVAMKQLQEGLPGGFNLDALLHVQPEALNRLIYPVGFHNRKTIYIKQVAVILKEQFDGDVSINRPFCSTPHPTSVEPQTVRTRQAPLKSVRTFIGSCLPSTHYSSDTPIDRGAHVFAWRRSENGISHHVSSMGTRRRHWS